jgi:hypothetical protein
MLEKARAGASEFETPEHIRIPQGRSFDPVGSPTLKVKYVGRSGGRSQRFIFQRSDSSSRRQHHAGRVRAATLKKLLTASISVAARRSGETTLSKAETHSRRHLLTRALDGRPLDQGAADGFGRAVQQRPGLDGFEVRGACSQ